ncbi:MAG: hypothetical protein ACKVZJ_16115 [Phycisphaerales bacterium]
MTDPSLDSDVNLARVFAAADALLIAIESSLGLEATIPIFVGDVGHGTHIPRGAFTPREATEGIRFLVRMGFIPAFARVPTRPPRRPTSFAPLVNRPGAFHV